MREVLLRQQTDTQKGDFTPNGGIKSCSNPLHEKSLVIMIGIEAANKNNAHPTFPRHTESAGHCCSRWPVCSFCLFSLKLLLLSNSAHFVCSISLSEAFAAGNRLLEEIKNPNTKCCSRKGSWIWKGPRSRTQPKGGKSRRSRVRPKARSSS